MGFQVITGDSAMVLAGLPDQSFHALITDPPAGIAFMGREWDSNKGGSEAWINWLRDILSVAMSKMKPGAHGLIWALPRTSHWTAMAAERAGFKIIDKIYYAFGSGFPKSTNVSMAIDKELGVEREKVRVPAAQIRNPKSLNGGHGQDGGDRPYMRKAQEVGYHDMTSPDPVSDEAKIWDGWGTRLKPAVEEWILVRKPIDRTVAHNVLTHGTGGLNIPACRIGTDTVGWGGTNGFTGTHEASKHGGLGAGAARPVTGRWPSHLVLSHGDACTDWQCDPECPAAIIDQKSGQSSDKGGASRFFYCPKPSRFERDGGLTDAADRQFSRVNDGGMESDPRWAPKTVKNHHETVKGIDLMRYLCRLITPPGGHVLDPFAGSGSTGCAAVLEGFSFTGIEMREDHAENARKRIAYHASLPQQGDLF